ncbi:MAG: aminotransferase class I/II-fold pyridoxal phosphate-dependent enzyme [Alphaproteobacteria bacterium]|nr:aminotransferase class I/II-fold pyridoxal phosphate-dependent enzyme [Alphaproteobacteria bacterium]
MLNDAVAGLGDYPFPRLAALLKDVAPAPGLDPIDLAVGEPKDGAPAMARDMLAGGFDGYGKYPPVPGTPELRRAIADWLTRRYALPAGMLNTDAQIAPLSGTREGLFMLPLAVVPERKAGARPAVLMPNPFYQVYKGGAVAARAEPVMLPATAATGFLPDLDTLDPVLLARTALLYVCSPSNPQGAVASRDYLAKAIALARAHDFVLAVDECYAEVYDTTPPPGGLEVAAATGSLANVVVFHSLSKRSSAPGLRSGFVAGCPTVMAAVRNLRNYSASGTPAAIMTAATALWRDESHVEAMRARYRARFEAVGRILGNRFGYYRPAGGFFLWLDVGDGEAATRRLWSTAAVRVLPGAYLSHTGPEGINLGAAYVRLALVHDAPVMAEAARRGAAALTD